MISCSKFDNYGDILTFEDVCELLKIKKTYCYKLFTDNTIKAFKIGREWRTMKSDLQEYLTNLTND